MKLNFRNPAAWLLTFTLLVVMSIGVAPSVAAAADVASVTTAGGVTTPYADFYAALRAAESSEGSTLKLLDNVKFGYNESDHLVTQGTFTIDLNGHTLSNQGKYGLTLENCQVTFTDTSSGGTGAMSFISANVPITVGQNAKAIIQSGSYTSERSNALKITEGGQAEINGGTFTSTNAIAVYNSKDSLTINGGSFTGKTYALYMNDGSSTVINGGSFSKGSKGTIDYDGGRLDLSQYNGTTPITDFVVDQDNNRVTLGPDTITLPVQYGFYEGDTQVFLLEIFKDYSIKQRPGNTVTVNGGTVKGATSATCYGGETVTITANTPAAGMVFDRWTVNSNNVKLEYPANINATTTFMMPEADVEVTAGYKQFIKEATWGESASSQPYEGELSDALEAATAKNSTVRYIQLQMDVSTSSIAEIGSGEFTLDLNGNDWNQGSGYVRIKGTADVTFTDTTSTPGTVTSTNSAITFGSSTNQSKPARCTINGGNYRGQNAVYVQEKGNLTINGGSFSSTQNHPIENSTGIVEINGGTFTAGNGSSVNVSEDSVNTVITGGTLSKGNHFGTIRYWGSKLDLSQYPAASITNITLHNSSTSAISVGAETITLREGYSFIDAQDKPVTTLQPDTQYRIAAHQHEYVDSKCNCGAVCPHSAIGDDGKCKACGKQYEAKITSGTKTTHYVLLSEAASACKSGETLTLLTDVTSNTNISLDDGSIHAEGEITFDLNQKTLTFTNGAYLKTASTYNDGHTIKNGTLIGNDTMVVLLERSTNLENCTIKSAGNRVVEIQGHANLENCTIIGQGNRGVYVSMGPDSLAYEERVKLKDCTITADMYPLYISFSLVAIGENVVLNTTSQDSKAADICISYYARAIDLSSANQQEYSVYVNDLSAPDDSDVSSLDGLDLNNDRYEFVHENGKLVSAENPIQTNERGFIHEHRWVYSADSNAYTITVTCGAQNCPVSPKPSMTVSLPEQSFVYDGTAKSVSPVYNIQNGEFTEKATVTSSGDNVNVSADGFTVTMTLGNASVSRTYAIAPLNIEGNAQLTVGNFQEMVYTGAAQTPVCEVNLGSQVVTGEWSMVTNVADTTTFTASGNYSGTIANRESGMQKATPSAKDFAVTLPDNLYYTGESKTASVSAAASVTGMGAITVKHSPENPVNEGSYDVLIDVAEGTNYTAVQDLKVGAFAIGKSGSVFSDVKTYLDDEERTEFTYGQTVTVKGSVQATGQEPAQTLSILRTFIAPAARQVALFDAAGTTPISAAADVGSDGAFELTYDTTGRLVEPADSVTLMVKFVGDDNMANEQTTFSIKLNKASLTPVLNGSVTKAYDGTDEVPENHGLSVDLNGRVGNETFGVVGAAYAYEDEKVGQNKTITASGFALSENDAKFYTLSANAVSDEIGTIEKAKLTGAAKPADQALDVYCADVEAAKAKLPATITYTIKNGGTIDLAISWSCENYINTPGAENTFTWTVNDAEKLACYEPETGVATGESIKVTNADALEVKLAGTDKAIDYDGSVFDVSTMFTIDKNAGKPAYEIASDSTGEGTLSESLLTITKFGSFRIRLTTAANGAYAAAEAEAVLTVDKGVPAVTVPTDLTACYGQTLSQIELPADENGVWNWLDGAALVGSVGQQKHKAVFEPKDLNLWNTVTADVTLLVVQSSTDLTGGLNHADGQYVYGDDIVVTLQAQASGKPAVRMLKNTFGQPEAKQMALYKRVEGQADEQITQPVSEENGQYVLTVRTEDKLLAIGEHTIVAKYVGDADTADTETVYAVSIAKKPLTLSDVTAQNRYYRKGDVTVDILSAKLNGLEADADGTDDVQFAAGQKGTLTSDAAGEYAKVMLNAPELSGMDAHWYTMEPAEHAVNVTILAIPADGLTIRVSMNENYTDADVQATDLGKIPALDTVEEIDTTLRLRVTEQGALSETAVLYDVILEYRDVDGTWMRADQEHFPEGGIEVVLPVVKGTTPASHTYIVVHMFATDMRGNKAGEVEYPVPTAYQNADGAWMLKFTVNGLSPIMVAAVPIPALPQTGDHSSILLYSMLLMMSVAMLIAMKKKVHRA